MIQLPISYYGGQIKEGSRGKQVLIIDHVDDRLSHYGTRITRINWPNLLSVTDGEPSAYKIDRVYIGLSDDIACKVAVDLAKEPHAFDWHLEALDNQLLSSVTLELTNSPRHPSPIYGSAIQEEARGDLSLILDMDAGGHSLYSMFQEELIRFTDGMAAQDPIKRVYVGVNKGAADRVIEKLPQVKLGDLRFYDLDRLIMDPRFLR